MKVLIHYIENHFFYTFFAFVYLYILLQAFAIPGPIFLCLLSPTLFGPLKGFFLCITVRHMVICSVLAWEPHCAT